MIECYFCTGLFPQMDGLKTHYKEEHVDEMATTLTEGRTLTIKCDSCGDSSRKPGGDISDRQYCSRDCYDNRGRTAKSTYVIDQKAKARERDDHECQDCGESQKRRKLDVHHIDRPEELERATDAHALSNLITLCVSCHMKREPRFTG